MLWDRVRSPAFWEGLLDAIPLEAQGEILDKLLGTALRGGSGDLWNSQAIAALSDAVVDALLTGDATPEAPAVEVLAAAAAAGLIPMAAILILQTALGAAAGAGESARIALGTAETPSAKTSGLAGLPATDPWNHPWEVREDGMVYWAPGHGPAGDGWVTPEEAGELVAESERLVARSDQWNDEFRASGKEMVEESMAQISARNEAEAAFERAARERNDRLREALKTIEESATRRGDLDVLQATASDDLFKPGRHPQPGPRGAPVKGHKGPYSP